MNLNKDKPQQERAYREMLKPVVEKLSKKDPERVAALCGGKYERDTVQMQTFNQIVSIDLSNGDILPALENWHSLVLLHYLNNADGTEPTGRWISFEDMKDGLIRGTKFAHASSGWMQKFLAGKKIDDVRQACETIGGKLALGKGDVCMNIPFLPRFPVLLSFWEEDEDFPATGKMLIDETADHFLSIEDAVTVGEIVQKRLAEAWSRISK